ncbi:conserved hypothetical protein [Arthrobacter sp. Hiyo8]|nr:conserved hypothetical protein [Arthrobacter sp. Hiyo8]
MIKGYSGFVRIGGNKVCLDTVEGYTDGTRRVPSSTRSGGRARNSWRRDHERRRMVSVPRYKSVAFVHPDFDAATGLPACG